APPNAIWVSNFEPINERRKENESSLHPCIAFCADNNSDYLAGAGFGRSIVNTQPLPGRLRTRSEPPFASTPRRLIPRPRPKPDRSPLRCSNSRNRSSASRGGRPPHSSSTSIKTRAADENVFSETRL